MAALMITTASSDASISRYISPSGKNQRDNLLPPRLARCVRSPFRSWSPVPGRATVLVGFVWPPRAATGRKRFDRSRPGRAHRDFADHRSRHHLFDIEVRWRHGNRRGSLSMGAGWVASCALLGSTGNISLPHEIWQGSRGRVLLHFPCGSVNGSMPSISKSVRSL